MTKAPPQVNIEIPQLTTQTIQITLIGDSELISHAWSQKAKEMMLNKQMKKADKGREAKDPFMDYCESLYWLTKMPKKPTPATVKKAKFGMPAVAFKNAAVNACSQVSTLTKVNARAAFHIENEFIEILGKPEMREDMVRVGMGTADIRYRGGFKEWKAKVTVVFNPLVLSAEQIVNLFNIAGFGIGIGDWRPQKNGSYGRFHVALEGES